MGQVATEASNEALAAIRERAVTDVASKLKENFPSLAVALRGVNIPSDDTEYLRMANQLIDERRVTVKKVDGSSQTYTIEDIQNIIPVEQLKQVFGGKTLNEMIPKAQQMHKIANAIGDGVEEETGSVGGATMKNAVQGFFKLMQEQGILAAIMALIGVIFGGGGEDNPLTQSIAQVTADKAGTSVATKLVQLRSNDPDVAQMLKEDEDIKNIAGKTRHAIMERAGIATPADATPSPEQKLAAVDQKPVDETTRAIVREGVEKRVQKDAEEAMFTKAKASFADPEKFREEVTRDLKWHEKAYAAVFTSTDEMLAEIPDAADTKRASQAVSKTVGMMLANPDYRYKGKTISELSKNPEEFKEAAYTAIKAALEEKHSTMPSVSPKVVEKIASEGAAKLTNDLSTLPIIANLGISGGIHVATGATVNPNAPNTQGNDRSVGG